MMLDIDKLLARALRVAMPIIVFGLLSVSAITIIGVSKEPKPNEWNFTVGKTYEEPSLEDVQTFMVWLRLLANGDTATLPDSVSMLLQRTVHIQLWKDRKRLASTTLWEKDAASNLENLKNVIKKVGADFDANTLIHLSFELSSRMPDELSAPPAKLCQREMPENSYLVTLHCNQSDAVITPMDFQFASHDNMCDSVTSYLLQVGCEELSLARGNGHMAVMKLATYVQPSASEQVAKWYGNDRLIPRDAVTRARLNQFVSDVISWFERNINKDGRLPYEFYSTLGFESAENQLIRQWLATRALGELATLTKNPKVEDMFHRSVAFNLEHYGEEKDGKLYFAYKDTSYLATNAMALHALSTTENYYKRYKKEYQKILAGLLAMKQVTQATFNTTIKPINTKRPPVPDHNFGSTAALFMMAEAIRNKRLDQQAAELEKYFDFSYGFWQKEEPLYGAPWHLLAYASIYRTDGQKQKYLDAIYRVADKLVGCQLDDTSRPHLIGAYNADGCRDASDLVFTAGMRSEGLFQAYLIAKEHGDKDRQKRYADSIKLAARYTLQGQIDAQNSFYMAKPERSLGGVRNSLYDNTIRIDSMGHNVSPIVLMLQHMDELQ